MAAADVFPQLLCRLRGLLAESDAIFASVTAKKYSTKGEAQAYRLSASSISAVIAEIGDFYAATPLLVTGALGAPAPRTGCSLGAPSNSDALSAGVALSTGSLGSLLSPLDSSCASPAPLGVVAAGVVPAPPGLVLAAAARPGGGPTVSLDPPCSAEGGERLALSSASAGAPLASRPRIAAAPSAAASRDPSPVLPAVLGRLAAAVSALEGESRRRRRRRRLRRRGAPASAVPGGRLVSVPAECAPVSVCAPVPVSVCAPPLLGRRGVRGTAGVSALLRAPPATARFFLTGLCAGVAASEVEAHLHASGVLPLECAPVRTRPGPSRSFFIRVLLGAAPALVAPSLWPDCAFIRPWKGPNPPPPPLSPPRGGVRAR